MAACKGGLRNKRSDAPPPQSNDMFIRHRKRRLYNRPGETKIRISNAPDMAYYHPFKSCTNLTAGDMWEGKIIVAEDAQKNLSILHKRVLFKEFGMMLNQLKDSCSLNACALLVRGRRNVGMRLSSDIDWVIKSYSNSLGHFFGSHKKLIQNPLLLFIFDLPL